MAMGGRLGRKLKYCYEETFARKRNLGAAPLTHFERFFNGFIAFFMAALGRPRRGARRPRCCRVNETLNIRVGFLAAD
jgi:hypothetical protein